MYQKIIEAGSQKWDPSENFIDHIVRHVDLPCFCSFTCSSMNPYVMLHKLYNCISNYVIIHCNYIVAFRKSIKSLINLRRSLHSITFPGFQLLKIMLNSATCTDVAATSRFGYFLSHIETKLGVTCTLG